MNLRLITLAIIGLLGVASFSVSAAPISPLDRVPADAQLFAHLKADGIWDHPAIAMLRKFYAKDLEKVLKDVEKETGLRPEQIHSATFHFPKIPGGNGDEALFVLQIVTKKPYDKATLLAGLRKDGEAVKDDVVVLREKLVAHLTSESQFTVLHESLLAEFKKGATKVTDGVMKEVIQAAKSGKSTLVAGLDPTGLPAEIFDNAPDELRPFLPLLKSKTIMLQANLDKELSLAVKFVGESEDKAIESERAFNLLMKLADDGITTLLKNDKVDEDLKSLFPSLMQVQKVVQGVKAVRQGMLVSASASIKADPELAKPLVALFLKPTMAAARSRSANNLKQIGLALHNYHDVYGVLPAAAIVDKKGKALLSWRVAILPFIEQDNLYKQFKLDEPWDSEHNIELSKVQIKTYTLPYVDESKPGITHYRAFVGNGAAFEPIQGLKFAQFTDGTSNTMFAFEAAEGVPWAKPDDLEFDPKKMGFKKHLRFEKNLCNILMCDGSVRAIPEVIKDEVLKLLIQRDDGQPIPDFDK